MAGIARKFAASSFVLAACALLAAFERPSLSGSTSTPQHLNVPTSQHLNASTIDRLTTDGNFKQHPAWSPDGKLVAFAIYLKGKVGLVAMTVGGSAPEPAKAGTPNEWKHITPLDESPEYEPAWSPDGKRIVFVHDSLSGTDGQLEIHAMNADGSESKRIVTPAKRPAQDEHPAWSPDGKTIAFTTTRDGNQEIYLCDADGSNLRRITTHTGIDSHPSWSPDGRQIAFCSQRFGNLEICVMNADGSDVRRLTDNPAVDYAPKWSPDAKQLAFTSTRDGNHEVYLVRPDGTGLRNLTQHPGLDKDPAWSPDSAHVLFVSNREGRFDLYSMPVGATAVGGGR